MGSPRDGESADANERRTPAVLVSELPPLSSMRSVGESFDVRALQSGVQTLVLVDTSCHCVDVREGGRRLVLGQSISVTDVRTVYVAGTLRRHAGEQSFTARFAQHYDDGTTAADPLELRIVAPVYADIELKPASVLLNCRVGNVQDSRVTLTVHRTYRAESAIKVRPTIQDCPNWIDVDSIQLCEPAQEFERGVWKETWQVDLHFDHSGMLGATNAPIVATVEFAPRGGGRPVEHELPIVVQRRVGIVAPHSLSVGVVPVGESRSRRLLIRAADDCEFAITRVHVEAPEFVASTTLNIPSVKHSIDVKFVATEVGKVPTKLVIYTTHPEQPEVSIPLFALVTPAIQADIYIDGD